MYIEQRGRRFYAIHELPKDLRDYFGTVRLSKALETTDAAEAAQRAAVLWEGWQEQMAAARGQQGDTSMAWPDEWTNEFYVLIADQIRQHRREAGLQQQHVAERIGVSRATMANIEGGRQRILVHRLYQIAEVFGVPLDDLIPKAEGP